MNPVTQSNTGTLKEHVLVHEKLQVFYLESNSSLKIDHLLDYDAIVIDATDLEFAKIIIKKFRTSHRSEYYLKPIFLINIKTPKDPIIEHLSDGSIFSLEQIKDIAGEIKEMIQRSTQLETSQGTTHEIQTFKKVLNYMYTREIKSLKPIPDSNSSIGYTYPVLSVNFEKFEESKVIEILEWAEREELIWPDYIDRIYLCNHCGNGHLLYREMCPFCDSSNMFAEDLVHHFLCGYVGPISDFKNGVDSALRCPKCSKNLRHIGVDYDKPSVINHCNNCNKNFQDYLVKAKCVQCAKDSEVQYLIPKSIHLYKLTKKGRNAAVSGIITNESQEYTDINGVVNVQTFKTIVHYALERNKNNGGLKANISILYFDNIFDVLKKLGKIKEKILLSDLVQIVRDSISPADFIAMLNPSLFYICINDISTEEAIIQIDKIKSKMESLIRNNFDAQNLHLHVHTEQISDREPFEIQLQSLTKKITEMHNQ